MKIKELITSMFAQMKSDWYLPVTEHQVYSTAETKIGVWTDGKPLYRKVVNITIVENQAQYLFSAIGLTDSYENIFAKSAHIKRSMEIWTNIPTILEFDTKTRCGIQIVNTSAEKYVNLQNNITAYNGQTLVIEFNYTKTTDTASTSKVPFEPLVEYSTDEKMIGYWIDGKKLYQKTISCGALPNTTKKIVATEIANVAKVVSIDGCATIAGSSDYAIRLPYVTYATQSGIRAAGVDYRKIDGGLEISANWDASGWTETYVTIKYTKTTD